MKFSVTWKFCFQQLRSCKLKQIWYNLNLGKDVKRQSSTSHFWLYITFSLVITVTFSNLGVDFKHVEMIILKLFYDDHKKWLNEQSFLYSGLINSINYYLSSLFSYMQNILIPKRAIITICVLYFLFPLILLSLIFSFFPQF